MDSVYTESRTGGASHVEEKALFVSERIRA